MKAAPTTATTAEAEAEAVVTKEAGAAAPAPEADSHQPHPEHLKLNSYSMMNRDQIFSLMNTEDNYSEHQSQKLSLNQKSTAGTTVTTMIPPRIQA